MAHTRIKICGITNVQDALLATRLGADAVGLNLFRGSKRCVDQDVAAKITCELPPFVTPVALFVSESLALAQGCAQRLGIGAIQWHGDDPELPPSSWTFIPAFNIAGGADLVRVTNYLDRCRTAKRLPTAVLLDGHALGQYGGTGRTAPWQLLADFQPGVPVILAGGLTPDNVAEAIRMVRPYAVDVASGVESAPGVKDGKKIGRFIDSVRAVQ